jgi:preprotein translocase subunit YajC
MSPQVAQILAALASQAPEGGGCGGAESQFLMPVVMVAILYFVWLRPANRERKQHQDMLGQLKRGDEIVTSSGILGTVADITEKIITLEVSKNVKIRVLRSTVARMHKETEAEAGDASATKPSK